ncbi:MAG: glycosyltransferase [Candidatus Spechtbacterales bacterium]
MPQGKEKLKVALMHDYMTQFGGAERVLSVLHGIFPSAPIYTLFYDEAVTQAYFAGADIRPSFLQKAPNFLRKRFKYLSLLAIPAVENFDFTGYDLVVSSCAFFAKGIITDPNTIHICYCHTPTKYLWEFHDKGNEKPQVKSFFERLVAHAFRIWDFQAVSRVDYFIANSKHTKRRIKKYYKEDSFIIYPAVAKEIIDNGTKADIIYKKSVMDSLPDNFYLIVSQLQDYKNIGVAVEAFSRMEYPLVVVGDGPEREKLEKIASKNIIFLGRQPDNVVQECYQKCRAYIYPGKEDFGISAVEAMLFGKPVLAYRSGGVLESVVEGVSGEFFDDLNPVNLADGIRRINENYERYNPQLIEGIGKRFSKERFKQEFKRVLKRILAHEWGVA